MRFLGRWLGHSVGMALALVLGILAMQAPAVTRDYATALQQVASALRRDIDEREAAARQYYGIAASSDEALIAALQPHEPSNAETLARSVDRARRLRQAYDAITRRAALLQPAIAFTTALDDPTGDERPIWETTLGRYTLQLELSAVALVYAVAGVLLGSLIGQVLLFPFRYRAAHRVAV